MRVERMIDVASDVFFALGDETRVELVRRLSVYGPQPTLRLVDGLSISRQAATRHLEVLEQSGVVKSRKVGREVLRELDSVVLDNAATWLAQRAMEWDDRLDSLKRFVEGSTELEREL